MNYPEYMTMAKKIGRHLSPPAKTNFTPDLENIEGEACFGLAVAIDTWDPKLTNDFKLYGITVIKQKVAEGLRNNDYRGRAYRVLSTRLHKLEDEANRTLDDDEAAELLGVTVKQVRNARKLSSVKHVEADLAINQPYRFRRIEDRLTAILIGRFIVEWIKRLPGRNGAIVRRYFLDEKKMADIGIEFNLSEPGISYVIKKAARSLAIKLKAAGLYKDARRMFLAGYDFKFF